jgi:hypothetical protein
VKPVKKPAKKVSKAKSARSGVKPTTKGLIDKQPEVKEEAAAQRGMFLYANDAWSLRYFNEDDLHFKEREVFG